MDALYSFPLIAQDLSREEYVVQIADSLQHLTDVVDDIFLRIHKRIDENASKTRDIIDRVSICRNKIDKLTESNKSTKIFSGAKYPMTDRHKDYHSVFTHDCGNVTLRRSENVTAGKSGSRSDDNQIQEKLEFYHVKQISGNSYQWLCNNQVAAGLGELPSEVESVTSLFRFNSKQYVYGLNSLKDTNRAHSVRVTQTDVERREAPLDAAPFSITNREQAAKKPTESYMYSPTATEAPLMNMPLDLPHLSGVAEDMQFINDINSQVSACTPEVEDTRKPKNDPSSVIQSDSVKAEALVPDDTVVIPRVNNEIETVPQQTPTPPVPPPPPPPLLPLLDANNFPEEKSETDASTGKSEPKIDKSAKSPKMNASVGDDGRSNLMEAIRKAGGSAKAKLRSVVDTKSEEKKPTGGDLMADLHAKLSMRRKGISVDKPSGGDSILDVISSRIPPPLPKTDQSSNAEVSSAEDDWD